MGVVRVSEVLVPVDKVEYGKCHHDRESDRTEITGVKH